MIKVIVIDDETDIIPLFKIKFKREIAKDEIKFTFFTSAEDTLSYLKQNDRENFHFILSDINMPGKSGLDLLKDIKTKNEGQKVFMLSADSQHQYQDEAEELGADGFLQKPVNFHKLKELFFT